MDMEETSKEILEVQTSKGTDTIGVLAGNSKLQHHPDWTKANPERLGSVVNKHRPDNSDRGSEVPQAYNLFHLSVFLLLGISYDLSDFPFL